MLNRVIIMGRLTKDPELRHTQNGTAVASFSVAVDRDRKKKDGEKEVDFIDIVAWRQTAEFVSKYFSKGRMAVIEGKIQVRQWTDKEGHKRNSVEVVAENLYFGGSKKSEGGSVRPQDGPSQAQDDYDGYGEGGGFTELNDDDGELPF